MYFHRTVLNCAPESVITRFITNGVVSAHLKLQSIQRIVGNHSG